MWLFYVDEFGDDSMQTVQGADGLTLKPGVAKWFVLSAVGFPDHCRLTLAKQLQLVKDRGFTPSWRKKPWKDTEIKGRFLRHAALRLAAGKSPWEPDGYKNLSAAAVAGLCTDLGWVMRKYRPIIYTIAIDKQALLAKGSPHSPVGIAYAFLQQRLALLVDQVLGTSEGVLIVADEQYSHEKAFRQGKLHGVRKALGRSLPTQPNFDLLLDKPVWVNAELSEVEREIIQLADIAAYAAGRTCVNWKAPAEAYCMWEPVFSCMALHWKEHTPRNAGFTIYPRPRHYPERMA